MNDSLISADSENNALCEKGEFMKKLIVGLRQRRRDIPNCRQ